MNIRWKMIGIAVPAALMLACTDQPTAVREATPAVTADFTNNIDNAGPWIGRYEFNQWVLYWTSDDGLVRAIHTTFPLSTTPPFDAWGWDDAVCGPSSLGSAHYQEISHWDPTHTDPSALYIENGVIDVWIVLVSRAPGQFGPCAGRPVIASGWGRMHYNDNNGGFIARPQDAWSYRVEGQLTAPTGEKVTYNAHQQCVVNQRIARCNLVMNY